MTQESVNYSDAPMGKLQYMSELRGETKFGIMTAVAMRRTFENMGRRALVRRGRSRAGVFAHGSNTPLSNPFVV